MKILTAKPPARKWREFFGRPAGLALVLAVVVIAAYFPVRNHEFTVYGDPVYLSDNPYVASGFTVPGFKRAFLELNTKETYWHPVTWVSHMLDAQLFGLAPGHHHLMGVLHHALNAVLLFLGLYWLTGKLWPSLLAASLFALHPLQVDTVAWAAERKNLLHALFGLLTIGAYSRYVIRRDRRWYFAALILFTLGLMSKPALVTLPCALLLLDYWPLRRLETPPSKSDGSAGLAGWKYCLQAIGKLIWEKVPFLGLSAVSAAITIIGHRRMEGLELTLTVGQRVRNAVVSYCKYLKKVIWPDDLAVYYPYSTTLSAGLVGGALMVLIGITAWVVWRRRTRPYLMVGWLWFLLNLLPTIGLVQVGSQAMADRFSYLPLVGVFVGLAFLLLDFSAASGLGQARLRYALAALVAVGAVIGLRLQLPYWRNSEILFHHALSVTKTNWFAEESLGTYYFNVGKYDDAGRHLRMAMDLHLDDDTPLLYAAVLNRQGRAAYAIEGLERYLSMARRPSAVYQRIGELWDDIGDRRKARANYEMAWSLWPGSEAARLRLAACHIAEKNWSAAREHYLWVLKRNPYNWRACIGMAEILFSEGSVEEANEYVRRSAKVCPLEYYRHFIFGILEARQGNWQAAEENYLRALALVPDFYDANYNLGHLYARGGKFADAARCFTKALAKRPNSEEAHSNLGLVLASQGNLSAAAEHYRAALQTAPNLAEAHYGLGRVLELQTNHVEAATHYGKALGVRTDFHEARLGLAMVLGRQQNWGAALPEWEMVVKANPASGLGHFQLGVTLLKLQRRAEALPHLERAVELRPRDGAAADTLARLLATAPEAAIRNGPRAVQLAEALCASPEAAVPGHLATLAAAYAEVASFDKAKSRATQALKAAQAAGNSALVQELNQHLALYGSGKPVRE